MTVRKIPEGFHSLTPHIVCAGAADAIGFYAKAFNAVELMRLPGPGGSVMHAELRIGSSVLMLMDENPEWNAIGPSALKASPVTLHHYVEDCDAAVKQAVEAGATLVMPPADMFWGDRYAVLKDPFGHSWSIGTHIKDMTPAEIAQAMQQAC